MPETIDHDWGENESAELLALKISTYSRIFRLSCLASEELRNAIVLNDPDFDARKCWKRVDVAPIEYEDEPGRPLGLEIVLEMSRSETSRQQRTYKHRHRELDVAEVDKTIARKVIAELDPDMRELLADHELPPTKHMLLHKLETRGAYDQIASMNERFETLQETVRAGRIFVPAVKHS